MKPAVNIFKVCDKSMALVYLIALFVNIQRVAVGTFDESEELLIDIDLPENHLSQYFNNLPDFVKQINLTSNGPYKEFLSSENYDRAVCWGYEIDCKKPQHTHKCPGNHTGYVESKDAQLDVFYAQADFGKQH